jgi:hypothetical protein
MHSAIVSSSPAATYRSTALSFESRQFASPISSFDTLGLVGALRSDATEPELLVELSCNALGLEPQHLLKYERRSRLVIAGKTSRALFRGTLPL